MIGIRGCPKERKLPTYVIPHQVAVNVDLAVRRTTIFDRVRGTGAPLSFRPLLSLLSVGPRQHLQPYRRHDGPPDDFLNVDHIPKVLHKVGAKNPQARR